MKKMIKAVVLMNAGQPQTGEHGRIEIREYPYPKCPEDGIIIRMLMSGICGTDRHEYVGDATLHTAGFPTRFPKIPGHENVGIIEEVGEKAQNMYVFPGEKPLAVGDRVVPGLGCHGTLNTPPYLWGGMAEYKYFGPPQGLAPLPDVRPRTNRYFVHKRVLRAFVDRCCYKVPNDVSDEAAVLSEPMWAAYGSFVRAAEKGYAPGASVVIQGSGPVGVLHAIIARLSGAGQIIMTGAPKYRLSLAKKIVRIDHTIDITKIRDPKDRVDEVLRLTDGLGADLVIECAGVPRAFPEGLDMMARYGIYIMIGNYMDTGTCMINPNRHIFGHAATVIGGIQHYEYPLSPFRCFKLMQEYSKEVAWDKVVSHKYPIDDAKEAFEKAVTQEAMKVVVTL